jgi:hypothetical protein
MPGEIDALTQAAATTWERMTPLIEVTGALSTGEPPQRSTIPNMADRLGPAITAGRPFFLDFPWMNSAAQVLVGRSGKRHRVNAVEHVYRGCRERGLSFIPVVGPHRDSGRLILVRDAVKADGRGVCLRIPLGGVVWPTETALAETLNRLLEAATCKAESADLVLDLGYLGAEPGFEASHILKHLKALPMLNAWRSLILLGTVIPETLAGMEEGGITEVPRHEWRLWKNLRALNPERLPTFGDYGIQHPQRPPKGGPGMRANVRYTTEDLVLFARGSSILEHGTAQYRTLCAMLIDRPEFKGASYSWGDRCIDHHAKTAHPPGEPAWRGAGTSHHLRLATDGVVTA